MPATGDAELHSVSDHGSHNAAMAAWLAASESSSDDDDASDASDASDDDDDANELLHGASTVGDAESIALLLTHGADANFTGRQGTPCLHTAAFNGHARAMELLLHAGAKVDAAEARGCTALHVAAQAGHKAAVSCLLAWHAEPLVTCALGTTPLQAARENGHADVARLLGELKMPTGCTDGDDGDDGDGGGGGGGGDDSSMAEVPPAFAAQARGMPLPLRRLLVHNCDPAAVSAAAVVHAMRLPIHQFRTAAAALAPPAAEVMLLRPAALGAAACATLRAAVDGAAATSADSVDGLADHQLDFKRLDDLAAAVGPDALEALRAMPAAFADGSAARAAAMGASAERLRISQVFVRRYARGERPWFTFHRDRGPLTVNVALASDDGHEGGALLALFDGAVRRVERHEGEAVVHPSTLLHGVSRMRGGVRYSLIVFYRRVEEDGEEEAPT